MRRAAAATRSSSTHASLDAARFERLLADGTHARREGNPELALSVLGRALALWRGQAYGEFGYEEFARGEAERLEELRMLTVEERFEAGLAFGRHEELLPELQSLAGEHPLRERLLGQAMLALYRCGRQTDALELYRTARDLLVDELGLEPSSELRELQRRILEQDPSLDVARAEDARLTDLPTAPNPLLGRDRELAELRELLLREDVRLLVLTGAGAPARRGSRSRLPTRRWRRLRTAPRSSSWRRCAIPRSFSARSCARLRSRSAATSRSRPWPRSCVPGSSCSCVDNAEHLHEATTAFSELLARAPRLTLLVTSRTVLHLSGEHVYPVLPLAEEAALALFHARARQADAHFDPGAADQAAMRRICVRLDGLPLAIELAAARTTSLRPSELLGRLDRSLPLLIGGPRDLPARQRTLQATLEWSFGLLSEEERALAGRLGVFVGSFDLDAATTVCDADLGTVTSLVEQSLLQRTTDGRFHYLETIREYALEQLLASPGADDVRRRHFRHFRELAEAADLSAVRRGAGERLDLAAEARDNLRAALAWSLETGSVALGLELATALERFWVTHDPREGMRWFTALLDHPESGNVAPVVRASALRAYGGTHDITGDHEAAERLWQQSLELFEELGDEHGKAVLLHRLGISAMRRGDLARARELVTESHRIHERTGDRWGQAQAIGTLGAIERDSGNEARAYELIAGSLMMAREAGVRWWESGLLAELATLSLKAGRTDEAEMQARECLMLAEEIGDRAGRVLGVGSARLWPRCADSASALRICGRPSPTRTAARRSAAGDATGRISKPRSASSWEQRGASPIQRTRYRSTTQSPSPCNRAYRRGVETRIGRAEGEGFEPSKSLHP